MTSRRSGINRVWVLDGFGKIVTINAERSQHWSRRSKASAEWRDQFGTLALAAGLPRCDVGPCHVHVHPLSTRRVPNQDVAACVPAAKAAIDGLVDAGVWPDDTPAWVVAVTFWPQMTGQPDEGLRLTLKEI